MPPLMNNPGQGGDVYGTGPHDFSWWNAHGTGLPPHNKKPAIKWRVKVGDAQYSYNVYLTTNPVPGTQLNDPNVDLAQKGYPLNEGQTLYTLSEWEYPAGTYNPGTPSSFTYHAGV